MRKCKPADLEFRASKTGHSVNTLKPWMEFELCGRWSLETSMFCCCNIHPLTHSLSLSLTHSLFLPSRLHVPTLVGRTAWALNTASEPHLQATEILQPRWHWQKVQKCWREARREIEFRSRGKTLKRLWIIFSERRLLRRDTTHAHTVNLR